MSAPACPLPAPEVDRPLCGTMPTAALSRRRLPGAVGADQAHPFAVAHASVTGPTTVTPLKETDDVAPGDHEEPLIVRRTRRKNGAPRKAVTTPMGSSAGATSGPGTEIGQDEERGAVDQGQRDDHPVAPAGEQPDGVGDDDPDKGDQAR